ncbi:urease accessory protein UreF [Azohydromonas aeria]|uniref:urease accessory protein UreF n=1 Tax=Azohydromonas aeria TaxID=2590212 RepID=UPI0012FA9EAE|nr:urease accessory UreF family protein [Azohydromonas aeria]
MAPQALLDLLWLASPALPVGGFSYSEALEAAVDSGRVTDEGSAGAWLRDQLALSLARADLAVVAAAHAAWRDGDEGRIRALNDWVLLTRESSELRQQAEQMGRSMLEWLRNQPGAGDDARLALLGSLKPPTWPVAWALGAARGGAAPEAVLTAHAFGWAENLVQAALKAVPLGQSAGQRILAGLSADIPAAVAHALSLDDGARQAFTPMLAILSARHETQYSRLFRS